MKQTLKNILKVLTWVILLAAFASLGFGTDNPGLMVPLYFIFFLVVFTLVFLYTKYKHRRTTVSTKRTEIIKKILGIVLVIAAVLTPFLFFRGIGFTTGIYLMLTGVTIVIIALAILAVRLINKKHFLQTLIGYILLIILCSMPAILMMQYDRSYHALGLAYYAALVLSVLAWSGIEILGKYIKIKI